jgi:dTDP-glucose 4,6-dehydratase
MRRLQSVVVTGGAGFIGSNFIRFLFANPEFDGKVVNIDALTYAGNRENLADIEEMHGGTRYHFVHSDICDRKAVESVFRRHQPDAVVHFAAESHVDRSVREPEAFVRTNVLGTFTMLDVARQAWAGKQGMVFHHVSTDEVFGSLEETGFFTEQTRYDPRSPYSASKGGSDHLVMSYYYTYQLPITLSNCSNNYGPFQFPEKLVPLMILNMLDGTPLPVYGDGGNIRDWLFVEDHSRAIWKIITEGRQGQGYNVGGRNEWPNIRLIHELCGAVARATGRNAVDFESLITFVKDRPGHDRRYAIDCSKIEHELGWKPLVTFEQGLEITVRWYLENKEWVDRVRAGAYRDWIPVNYENR